MRLHITKEKDCEPSVKIFHNDREIEFDYVEMIKLLYKEKIMDDPIIDDKISKEQRDILNNMVKEINNTMKSGID